MPSLTCRTCGQEHAGLPLDYSFGLPDEVFSLDFIPRYLRARSNSDLCTLDDSRHFMRGVIPLAFTDTTEEYCWGVWIEVSKADHDKYVHGYFDDMSTEPEFKGRLANDIPGYGSTLGLEVIGRYSPEGKRPKYYLLESASNRLEVDQRVGIDSSRHHEMLQALGHFDRKSAA